MGYIENPKTKGSGIVCCVPQKGLCPNRCDDCFFQSGRSYLEPLEENLPNMPPEDVVGDLVVRVNDGNDSNVQRDQVISDTARYPRRFFNTAIPKNLGSFPSPVVLTLNPGEHTDFDVLMLAKEQVPPNLMFVRWRTNTWNLDLCDEAIEVYAGVCGVPVVLTFMAYFDTADKIPADHRANYRFRKRTLNSYWAITHEAWRRVMAWCSNNPLVHSCGTEDAPNGSLCRNCGNCLREYHATMLRMKETKQCPTQPAAR